MSEHVAMCKDNCHLVFRSFTARGLVVPLLRGITSGYGAGQQRGKG